MLLCWCDFFPLKKKTAHTLKSLTSENVPETFLKMFQVFKYSCLSVTSTKDQYIWPVSDHIAVEEKNLYLPVNCRLSKQIVKSDPPVSSQGRPEIMFYP